MTSGSGKSISIDPAKHAASVHGILGCTDCHTTIKDFPHPDKVVKVQCSTCHAEEASHVAGSIHGALGEELANPATAIHTKSPLQPRRRQPSARSVTPMK